ncbi:MAG: hypothetical protein R3D59_08100 [Paracoccaceae bacterium]
MEDAARGQGARTEWNSGSARRGGKALSKIETTFLSVWPRRECSEVKARGGRRGLFR